jgi:RHS repeat-associated protein
MKRHDYLPFGEELFAPISGRSAAQGYAGGDGVRQQFTQKERDIETGLDYFGYRYLSSTQGRWTSVDPLIDFQRNNGEPQAWNLYQYCVNNPLARTDPDGRQDSVRLNGNHAIEQELRKQGLNDEQIKMFMAELRRQQKQILIGLAAGALVGRFGPPIYQALLLWAARNPDKAEAIALGVQEAGGGPPGLTVSAGTRLTASEISTGGRLAEQTGLRLSQSPHIGAEFVSAAGKTYDAMGSAAAYATKNWGNGSEFFKSILHHVNKSVDYVAIDLKGASKDQISAIEKYVAGLTKEQQAKIVYVR